MSIIKDNIILIDETNEEFVKALDLIKHTTQNVYLTGKAGTGKTTFLKRIRETTKKNVVILAPTGVAAINAGGQTIHSFFLIKPSVYIPDDKRFRQSVPSGEKDKTTIYDHFKYDTDRLNILKNLELLVIDEISMVRCDLLDTIDTLLRVFRNKKHLPFGGIQVVLIGDMFQLPPVADDEHWNILRPYYESPFFFSSHVVQKANFFNIELKKIYRQNEQEFIDLLNKIRVNDVSDEDLNLLNSRYDPSFSPKDEDNYITLATHNKLVERTNITKLSQLEGDPQVFNAVITGDFPLNSMPTDMVLQLKAKAQIIFIKNNRGRYYNGKISTIAEITDGKILVKIGEDTKMLLEQETWHNIKYTWDKKEEKIIEETIGTFTQFPIKLAWAITVHKSQGLTFDKVIADVGTAFAHGQVYVALSRCTSFNGLVLKSLIDKRAIKTDYRVVEFAKKKTPDTLINQELNYGKANYFYKEARKNIKIFNFTEAYDNFLKAIKFRNDIETEVFKKYFIITATRLSGFAKKYHDISEQLKIEQGFTEELRAELETITYSHTEQTEEINSQTEKIESLSGKIHILEESNRILEGNIELAHTEKNTLERGLLAHKEIIQKNTQTIQSLKNEKENLEEKLSQYHRIIQVDEKTILNLRKERESTEKQLSQYMQIVKKNEQTILNLEKTIQQNQKEIERLKNIKWYQKLFG